MTPISIGIAGALLQIVLFEWQKQFHKTVFMPYR